MQTQIYTNERACIRVLIAKVPPDGGCTGCAGSGRAGAGRAGCGTGGTGATGRGSGLASGGFTGSNLALRSMEHFGACEASTRLGGAGSGSVAPEPRDHAEIGNSPGFVGRA